MVTRLRLTLTGILRNDVRTGFFYIIIYNINFNATSLYKTGGYLNILKHNVMYISWHTDLTQKGNIDNKLKQLCPL